MSCKGLKNSALRKCMKEYVQESTRRFPTFNKVQDTVITTTGTVPNAVKAHQSMKLQAYGQGEGESNNSLYSDGSYISRNKVKKKE
jgi:hypothetical protein